MVTFLEKLKKGMGLEEVSLEEEKPQKTVKEKQKKAKEKKASLQLEEKEEVKEKKEAKEEEEVEEKKNEWPEAEGQLVVDVFQTENDLFIQAPIAGVKAEDLDIEIEKDILTIRGERKKPTIEGADYFINECYWGKFYRQIILPVEIDPNRVEAFLTEGILTIRMPKLLKEKKRKIIPKEKS